MSIAPAITPMDREFQHLQEIRSRTFIRRLIKSAKESDSLTAQIIQGFLNHYGYNHLASTEGIKYLCSQKIY